VTQLANQSEILHGRLRHASTLARPNLALIAEWVGTTGASEVQSLVKFTFLAVFPRQGWLCMLLKLKCGVEDRSSGSLSCTYISWPW